MPSDTTSSLSEALARLCGKPTFAHNLTTFGLINGAATILLSLGALTVMAGAPDEVIAADIGDS